MYVPLPRHGRNCDDGTPSISNFDKYTTSGPYNQSLEPTASDLYPADNSGVCTTSGGCTINGHLIPEDSVYWEFDEMKAGNTTKVRFKLQTVNGWEDDTQYCMNTYAVGDRADTFTTDQDPSTPGVNDSLVTRLVSAPGPGIRKTTSGTIPLSGINYAYDGGGYGQNI